MSARFQVLLHEGRWVSGLSVTLGGLIARVPFPIDERLVARQIEAAKAHPIEHVKPLIKPRERA